MQSLKFFALVLALVGAIPMVPQKALLHSKPSAVKEHEKHEVSLQSKIAKMQEANPTATKAACEACVSAEDTLVADMGTLVAAESALADATTALEAATDAHDTCSGHVTTCTSDVAEKREAVSTRMTDIQTTSVAATNLVLGEVTQNDADAALASAPALDAIASRGTVIEDWKAAKEACEAKVADCNSKQTTKTDAQAVVDTKTAAVAAATSGKSDAERKANIACANMRKAGVGGSGTAATYALTGATPTSASTCTAVSPVPPSCVNDPKWLHTAHLGSTVSAMLLDYGRTHGTVAENSWWRSCTDVAQQLGNPVGDAVVMKIEMGCNTDYFRPSARSSICGMVNVYGSHFDWSPDGKTWYTPEPYNHHMGGSKHLWPRTVDSTDVRAFLPFWNDNDNGRRSAATHGSGACCSYANDQSVHWFREYDMCFQLAA